MGDPGHWPRRRLDGRSAVVLTRDDADDWRAYYPHGEVLFVALGDDRVEVEDVMSALASRVVARSPESSAEPAPWFEGRVEVPGHEVSFSVPPGWVGIDLWGDVDRQLAEVVGSFDPVSCQDCEQSLRAGIDRVTTTDDWLVLLDPRNGDACAVTIGYAGSSAPSLADLAEDLAENVAAHPTVTDLEAPVYLDLLVGPAVRINMTNVDPGRPAPSGATFYMALDDERRLLVFVSCSALAERPSDDWLSIAETFEFLPAE